MYYTQGKVLREKDVFLCVQITVCKSKYCISSDEKMFTLCIEQINTLNSWQFTSLRMIYIIVDICTSSSQKHSVSELKGTVTDEGTCLVESRPAMRLLNFKVKSYFLKGKLKIKTNPLIFLCQVITVWDEIQIEIVATGCDSPLLTARVTGVIECVFDCPRPMANSTVTQTRSSQRERLASAHNPSVPDYYEHRSATKMIKVEEHYLGNKIIKTDGRVVLAKKLSTLFQSPLALKSFHFR